MSGTWQIPAARRASMLSPMEFRFLNAVHEISTAVDWNSPALPKLWLYNLHYFDDLNAEGAATRSRWHRSLISRWITDNTPGAGNGWEPYPLSIRIINWIKWTLAGNELGDAARHSMAVQVRFLSGRIERHLLGNHLFVNAKAMVFAGCYFEGEEAAGWLRAGMKILEREVPEQILSDGGHFERSTMYHALAYEDMLDLVNLARSYPEVMSSWQPAVSSWQEHIVRMGAWLRCMSHPDGEIAFFNDAAHGIAPSPLSLFDYAQRLGQPPALVEKDVIRLDPSGYIRVAFGPAVLLIDAAPIGPDYLPGHAHADTLSYELSLYGQRLVVNSGTSRYGLGPERQFERSTAAHSTVEVDGESSSEVWSGFRVARRAYPFAISIEREGGAVIVEAAHDGYRRLPGRVIHRRRWCLQKERLEVVDFIEGDFSEAVARVFFHPGVQVDKTASEGTVSWGDRRLRWGTNAISSSVETSFWYPEFGLKVSNRKLSMNMIYGTGNSSCRFLLDWA